MEIFIFILKALVSVLGLGVQTTLKEVFLLVTAAIQQSYHGFTKHPPTHTVPLTHAVTSAVS